MALTVGDVVARFKSESPTDGEVDSWLDQTLPTLDLKVSDALGYFRVRREPWSTDDEAFLGLDLPPGEACEREVYALAETAMFHCSDDGAAGPEAVAEAVRAGRIALVRSRLHLAITTSQSLPPDDAAGSDWHGAIGEWRAVELPVVLNDVDFVALEPVFEPRHHAPQGQAFHVVVAHQWARARTRSVTTRDRREGLARLRMVLAGAAFAFVDGAMLSEDPGRAIRLVASAANALSTLSAFIDEGSDRAAEAGRRGSDVRHERTRSLKAWAIGEALKTKGDDMTIARTLAKRLPPALAQVSVDPARFIYDALRANRRSAC